MFRGVGPINFPPQGGQPAAEGIRGEHLHPHAEAEQVAVQPLVLGEHRLHQKRTVRLGGHAVLAELVVHPVGHVGGKAQLGLHPEQGRDVPGKFHVRRLQAAVEHLPGRLRG